MTTRKKQITLQVGSVILAPGFKAFDPAPLDSYAYDTPTGCGDRARIRADPLGHRSLYRSVCCGPPVCAAKKRLANIRKKLPGCSVWAPGKSIAVIMAIVPRSAACTLSNRRSWPRTTAPTPLDCAIFYMDMRTQGKDFDRYCRKCQKNGVRFIRSRIHTVESVIGSDDLLLRYTDNDGRPKKKPLIWSSFPPVWKSARIRSRWQRPWASIWINYHFTDTDSFHPVATSVPGIYACGVLTGPKDIPQSVMEASAAACAATEKLAPAATPAPQN